MKFEFKVTVQYAQWQNASSCDPLMAKVNVSNFRWFVFGMSFDVPVLKICVLKLDYLNLE